MKALILLSLAVASPAMAADQFDLVCTGFRQGVPLGHKTPETVRYRVDLAAKTWCKEDCSTVLSLASVDAGRISFQSASRGVQGYDQYHFVSRTTGEWLNYMSNPFHNEEGHCEAAPFSGMPSQKF